MHFRFWKMGSTERVYINDLDCLNGEAEKAYIKPLPKKQRTGEGKEIGVELVVTNEAIRPAVESALEQYGLMPDGTIETGCFAIYKNIADKHRFTGGSLIKGPAVAAVDDVDTVGTVDSASKPGPMPPKRLLGSLCRAVETMESSFGARRASTVRLESEHRAFMHRNRMRDAKTAESWIEDLAELRDHGGSLEEAIGINGPPFGLTPCVSHSNTASMARLALLYGYSYREMSSSRLKMFKAHNALWYLGHFIRWDEDPMLPDDRPSMPPPSCLGELRLLLYCLYANFKVVPADEFIDHTTLLTFGQITGQAPALREKGLAFRPGVEGHCAALHEQPTQVRYFEDAPIPLAALYAAFVAEFNEPCPFVPEKLAR